MFQLCDEKDLQRLFAKCQALFYKTPFYNLQEASLISSPPQPPCSLPLIFKFFPNEDIETNKLFNILLALYHLCATFCLIIDVTPSIVNFYISIRSFPDSLDASCILKQLLPFNLEQVSSNALNVDSIQAITSLTYIPQTENLSNSLFSDFLSLTKGKCFKLFFLATPISPHQYHIDTNEIADLCTALTPLRRIERIHHHHHTDTSSTTCTNNTNQSQNTSCTNTQTTTDVANTSNTCAQTLSLNTVQTKLLGATQNNNGSFTNGSSDTRSDSSSNTNANQCNESNTLTKTNGITCLDIDTSRHEIENKHAISLLAQGQNVLTYSEETLKEPLYTFNTFFASCNIATTLVATSCFLNLVPVTSLYPSFVNSWSETYKHFNCLKEELLCLNPLVFKTRPKDHSSFVLGLPVSTSTLASFLNTFIRK